MDFNLLLFIFFSKICHDESSSISICSRKTIKKSNYPLPRDIIARTIIRIGEVALSDLEEIIKLGERDQILEAIDAIGFITFYSLNDRSLPFLWQVLEKYPNDALLTWKVVRAFESFPDTEVISFLKQILDQNKLIGITNEARRSLTQINNLKKSWDKK